MKKSFKLENLCCANCAAKIEREIGKLDGVTSATVGFMTQRLTIEADDEKFDQIMDQAEKIIKRIEPDCILKR